MRRLLAPALLVLLATGCLRSSAGTGAGAAAKPAVPARPALVTAANVALGDSLFNNGGCMRCHGAKGVGGNNGPALNDQQWVQFAEGTYENIRALIVSGVPAANIKDPARKNPMGARGGRMNLNDAQIDAVAAYVWTLSHP
jgi:mono/diheme cytochrome c family protein